VVRLEPDAVVLDMTSTTLDCLALCRWLRTSPEGEAISVLAVGSPGDEEAAWADAYVPSDAASGGLEAELGTLLESR